MKRKDIKKSSGELMRFVLVGIVATLIHYVLYFLLLGVVHHNIAYTVGYLVSFGCNYVLSSRYTFRVPMTTQKLAGFAVSHLSNYLIQLGLLNLFIWMGLSEKLAPWPVFLIAVPINFLLVRFALTRRNQANDSLVLYLLLAGFAILWLNLLDMPTMSDDIIYRFMWNSDETAAVQPIGGLGDLLQSQVTHYLSTNGRFVVHLLVQGFYVFIPPVVVQLLNTVLFVVLLWLCTRWVARPAHRLFVAVAVTFFIFVVMQGFRTTMVWSLGAFNYLWVLVGVMSLLLWLRHIQAETITTRHWLLATLALLVGWSHEGLSLPLSVAFALWLLRNRKQWKSAVTPYLLFFMVGTLLCLLSPGIWNRTGEVVGLPMRLINGSLNIVFNMRIGWLLLLTLFIIGRKNKELLKTHLHEQLYGYVALLASVGIIFLCGTTLERVAFFTDFIAMLLWLRLLTEMLSAKWSKRLVIAAGILMLLCYVPAYLVRQENKENWNFAEEQMRRPGQELIAVRQPQKDDCRLMNYFRKHYVIPSFEFGVFCSYMGFDANDINMRCAARLYHKEKLVFLPEDVVQRINTDSYAYTNYEMDENENLYIWRLNDNADVKRVTFVLNDEDPSQLSLPQRLLAYDGNTYDLDDFHYEVVSVDGRRYLVFTRPTTNIYRRINQVEYE